MAETIISDKAMQAAPGERDRWLIEAGARGAGRLIGRITPSGERRFYYRYTDSRGGRVRLLIGAYDARGNGDASFTVKQARNRALEWQALHSAGTRDLREHFATAHADAEQAKDDARKTAATARQAADALEQATQLAQQRRLTLRQVFDDWRRADLQPRVRADGKRTGRVDGGQYVFEQFTRHVFPTIGSEALEEVSKADLLALLDTQKSAGKMRTANVLLAELKQMLDFALERELINRNPLATVKKSKVGGPSVERDRVLGEEELKLLPAAIASARMHTRNAIAIWLTLATGVRVGELMGAVWAEGLPETGHAYQSRLGALQALCDSKAVTAAQKRIAKAMAKGDDKQIERAGQQLAAYEEFGDPDRVKVGVIDTTARTWYLPDTKNQRDHTIHLSDFALVQLEVLRQHREVQIKSVNRELSPWVFPATDNSMPVCVKSFGKQLADRQRTPEQRLSNRTKAVTSLTMPGGRWTAHDLRRTAATLMARCDFGSDTINECLNHMQADRMARVYIRDRREADQVRAFNALGTRLAAIVSGEAPVSNAVAIKAA